MSSKSKLFRKVKVTLVEERVRDAWFDLSLRQMREGRVRYYRVGDLLTGVWLFKVCFDEDIGKKVVKAIKCPTGRVFAQLEGNSMVFQRSQLPGLVYDVMALSYLDESGSVRRRIINSPDDVPKILQECFMIQPYTEASGKTAPGKNLVTVVGEEDDKAMIALFLLERSWPLLQMPAEELMRVLSEGVGYAARKRGKRISTGQLTECPICAVSLELVHVESQGVSKHSLRKGVETGGQEEGEDAQVSFINTSSGEKTSPDLTDASST